MPLNVRQAALTNAANEQDVYVPTSMPVAAVTPTPVPEQDVLPTFVAENPELSRVNMQNIRPAVSRPVTPQQVETQTQTTTKQVNPAFANSLNSAQNSLNTADKTRRDAINEGVKIQNEIADIQIKSMNDAAKINLEMEKGYAEQQKIYNGAAANQDRSIATAKDDYQKANIDPNRIFKGDNNNRLLAAISLSLGALGAGLTGQKNYSADIIDGIIDRDIKEQQFEAQKKYTVYENAKNERAILDSRFKTDTEKLLFATNMRLDTAKKQYETILATAKKPEIINNAKEMIAALEEKKAANTMQLYQIAMNGAPTVSKVSQAASVPGGITEKDNNEYLAAKNSMDGVLSLFDKASAIRGIEGMTPSMLGGKRAEIKALQGMIGATLAKDWGQRSDSDWQNIIKDALPDPTDSDEVLANKRAYLIRTLHNYAPAGFLKVENQRLNQNWKAKSAQTMP